MRTNSKEVRNQIKQHIIDCVYNYDENEFSTFEEAAQHLANEFKRVADHKNNMRRFPNAQDRFQDYLMALPFHFEYGNHKIESYLNSLGINPDGKKYPAEKMAHLYAYLIFREIQPFYN